jgi:hypothetical protein
MVRVVCATKILADKKDHTIFMFSRFEGTLDHHFTLVVRIESVSDVGIRIFYPAEGAAMRIVENDYNAI